MSTLNVPRRALPTQGDTIADAIGQVAQTFADNQLIQEAIDARQRADEARIEFQDRALAQRAALAMAAEDAGILAAELQRKAKVTATGEARAFTDFQRIERQEFQAEEAEKKREPITRVGEAAELTDILKAGQDIFTKETTDALEKQIRSKLAPASEPVEVAAPKAFSDVDSFTAAFQADQGRPPSKTELERARTAGILTDTPAAAAGVTGLVFPPR